MLRGTFERFFAERNRIAESRLRKTIAIFFRAHSERLPAQGDGHDPSASGADPKTYPDAPGRPAAVDNPPSTAGTARPSGPIREPARDDNEAERATLETKVRQAGMGKDAGLRRKLQGPAFEVDTPLMKDAALALQSGATKTGSDYRRYFYSGASSAAAGVQARAEVIGDETNGGAGQLQLQKRVGNLGFNYTTMQNERFESDQTGFGKKLARSFNQVGMDWYAEPALLGVMVRDTTRVTGEAVREIRSYQAMPLGPLTLAHSTATPTGETGALGTFGTLSLSQYSDAFGYYVDLDYGDGKRPKPSSVSFGIDAYDVGGWQLNATAGAAFDGSYAGADVRLVKEVAGIRFGPVLGVDNLVQGYALFRAWLPLSGGTSPLNWVAEGERPRLHGADPQEEWCRTTATCR
jgi:hypothetical protein